MVLPLLLGLLGSGLGSAGMLGGLGALGAGAIGSGLGSAIETGSLEKGILTGLGSFAGGTLAGKLLGGAAATGADKIVGGTAAANPMATGAASLPLSANYATIGSGANAMNTVAKPGLLQTAKSIATTPQFMGSQVGGMLGGMAADKFLSKKDKEGKSNWDSNEYSPIPRNYVNPPAGYRPGFDPEWNYGISTPQSAADIRAYNTQGTLPTDPNRLRLGYAGGGLVNASPIRMASGGIADFMGGGEEAPAENEKDVISNAIAVIKGESDVDPRIALAKFVAAYGEDALRDLVDKVKSGAVDRTAAKSEGKIDGPGDGMDDRVPAKAGGKQDVLLADGEYIVPADVTSHLGNGSTDAGAKQLDAMLERVREARTGNPKQGKQINPKEMLPA